MKLQKLTSLALAGIMTIGATGVAAVPATAFAAPAAAVGALDSASVQDYPNVISTELHVSQPAVFEKNVDCSYDEYNERMRYSLGDTKDYVQIGDYITELRSDDDGHQMAFNYYFDGEYFYTEDRREVLVYGVHYDATQTALNSNNPRIVLVSRYGDDVYIPAQIIDATDGWHGDIYIRDGERVTGWQTIDGTLYYFAEGGYMARNHREKIDGDFYYFDENGQIVTGNYDRGEITIDMRNGSVELPDDVYRAVFTTLCDTEMPQKDMWYLFIDDDVYSDIDATPSEDWSTWTLQVSEWNNAKGTYTCTHPDSPHSGDDYYSKVTFIFDEESTAPSIDRGSYTLDFHGSDIKVSKETFDLLCKSFQAEEDSHFGPEGSIYDNNGSQIRMSVYNDAIYFDYRYVDNNKNVVLTYSHGAWPQGQLTLTYPIEQYPGGEYFSKVIIKYDIVTGWYTAGDKTYYYKNSVQVKYRQSIEGKLYYFNGNGILQKGGWIKGNTWLYADKDGVLQTGWKYLDGKWYFFDTNGAMRTGWVFTGGKWYHMNGSGAMQTGWLYDNGKWYYLSGSGAMQTGWLYDNGNWYYLDASGAMQTGWIYVGGKWYYMNGSGSMRTANLYYKGKTYRFNSSGACINP